MIDFITSLKDGQLVLVCTIDNFTKHLNNLAY